MNYITVLFFAFAIVASMFQTGTCLKLMKRSPSAVGEPCASALNCWTGVCLESFCQRKLIYFIKSFKFRISLLEN